MNRAEEDLLVLAAQEGNERAFEYLFRHYHRRLVHFAAGLCRDRELASEAVQEAWIRIAKRIRRLEDPRAFRSWLYRAVRWQVLDKLKRPREPLEPLDESVIASPQVAGALEHPVDLRSLIGQLPAPDRQALHLFYLDEMKIREIALVLEVPAGTIKSRLNRARNRLRELAGHGEQA